MGTASGQSSEALLRELAEAIRTAPEKPVEVEVGIALSIALGRQRPSVSCGGCQTPLEVAGVPARTNVQLKVPYRLIFAGSAAPREPRSSGS
ncbi:MAG: hypothetical protein AAFA34_04285 [Thermoplasmata archaeon]|jgi:hypothetical protein